MYNSYEPLSYLEAEFGSNMFCDEKITKIAFTFILAIYDNHIKIRVHHSSPLK